MQFVLEGGVHGGVLAVLVKDQGAHVDVVGGLLLAFGGFIYVSGKGV